MFAVVLVVAGVVFAFNDDEDPDRLDTISRATTTTTEKPVTPGVVVSTSVPLTPSTAAASTTTTRPRRSTTTTTTIAAQTEFPDAPAELICAETTRSEPAPAQSDWATYWTTKPEPNDELLLKICVEDATPKIGTTLKLYVLAQDKDAEIGTGGCDIFVTWNSNSGSSCRDTAIAPPDEPKPTPPQKPGRVTMTYIHEYSEPGEWIIDVSAWSGPDNDEPHPYASYNSIELRVNAHR
ncbi:MAG: hypothetical protein Q8K63_09845 [Acidimicrobiales bacterium]|nr:hypothetical protein [Acidimicrobiales bacterium]